MCAEIVLMLTTVPPPSAAIRVPMAAVSRNGPFRFSAMVLSKSSSLIASTLS